MKKSRKIIFFILVLVLVAFSAFQLASGRLVERANAISIRKISPDELGNGIYSGHCELEPVEVDLDVTIDNGQIHAIDITKHTNGLGKKAENIVDTIIEEQSLDVDNVSGATVSSVAIKKAIEDALNES